MLDHVLIVVLMALVATGAYEVQQEGMILEKLGKFWHMAVGSSFWEKPLWACPVCMVSVWGIPVHLAFCITTSFEFWTWSLIVHLFASAGLAAYLNK